MANVKFQRNSNGFREFMKSEEVQAMLEGYANAAVSRLGSGYSSNSRVGRTRANAEITADSYEARRENCKNNTILKALK